MNSLAFRRPLAAWAHIGSPAGKGIDPAFLSHKGENLADGAAADRELLIELVDRRDGPSFTIDACHDPLGQRLVQLFPHQSILVELDHHVRDARTSRQGLTWRDLPWQASACTCMPWQTVTRNARNYQVKPIDMPLPDRAQDGVPA